MDKRVIVFLILSLGIILSYDFLIKQIGLAPPDLGREQSSAPISDRPASSGAAPDPSSSGAPSTRSNDALPPISSGSAHAVGEQIEEVSTNLYRARFTNRGGEIVGWELSRFSTSEKDGSKPIQLMYQEGKFKRPLSIQPGDVDKGRELGEALYQVERDFTTLSPDHPVGHLTYTYRAPTGTVAVRKHLTFRYDSYLVDMALSLEGIPGPFDVGLGTNFGVVEWGEGFIGLIGPASLVDEKLEKDVPDSQSDRQGEVHWLALQDKYFISVLIPTGASSVTVKKEADKLVTAMAHYTGAGTGAPLTFRLYAGPKEYDTLKALNLGLEDTIDFGWFIYGSWSIVKAVAKPLFSVLRFLYDFTHNYGLSIILLTIAIKGLFVPLQYKSYKSMKQMQEVQPKVVALQAKFKDDRDRLNKELIKLYRDHKVNPVGGCLPMLLQTPVFVALFNILYMTIDLRQAPFFGWITDLSVQDPYYILPVIMGVSMIVQQKIMPTTMDPTQAKIMLILPAFMTLLFLTFPAGLVLYWLTNNVLTISQQFVTDRYVFKTSTPFFNSPSTPDAGEVVEGKPSKRAREKNPPSSESSSSAKS
ncbi:MAG: membrane protein insertase YidC [Nitrospirae bacterium]|nr:membrane protein insertase YidC [Nitrospirota bacterium]